jgi:hypothetical protein
MARRRVILVLLCVTAPLCGVVFAGPAARPAPVLFPAGPADQALLQRQAADPRLLRLKAAVFDPLYHAEPDFTGLLPSGPVLRELVGAGPYLIQFSGPIDATARDALFERGLDILGYVPNRTLVVRPRPGASVDLQSVPGRRWVGTFRPGYKLDVELVRLLPASEAALESFTIDVILFRGEDPWPLVDAVEKRFDDVDIVYVKRGHPSFITLDVSASSLEPLVGSLIADAGVQFVARRPRFELYNDNSVWIGQSYDRINGPAEAQEADPKPYVQSATIWSRGITGEGQIVAVADSGLEAGMCYFEDLTHPVTPQTVFPPGPLVVDNDHRKIVALNAPFPSSLSTDDTFRHGTHVAGSAVGDSLVNAAGGGDPGHDHGDGMAPGARLVFEDISGPVNSICFTSIVVNSVEQLLVQEYGAGARISTNSWGPGSPASALGVDTAIWNHEDYLVLWSAGNEGAGGLDNLATCKNCISVGATENYDEDFNDVFGILDPENMAAFSSRGPTIDGRLKPDLVAPGYLVDSSRFPVEYFPDEDDPACDPGDPRVCFPGFGGCYVTDTSATCNSGFLLGTSMASPVSAGLAALTRQYFMDGFHPTGQAVTGDGLVPSAALLKAVMINGARNMTGHLYERRSTPTDLGPLADAPSPVQGWGRVMLDDALYFTGDGRRSYLFDIPNAHGLATGESLRVGFDVADANEPLKLTLVWTGPPALPSSGALVNDLDLVLAAPDGRIYRGNQWTADNVNVPGDKQSRPNPFGKDSLNNVEGILISTPTTGLYTVTVVGSAVPGGEGLVTQGAALVATGSVAPCTAVTAPQNLSVPYATSAQVELTWDAVPGALGYTLLRSESTCSIPMASDEVVSIPVGQTSYVDTDVGPQTSYNYTVRAVLTAEGCETADSNCLALTTPRVGPQPIPNGVFGLPVLAAKRNDEGTNIRVTWDVFCGGAGYHLLYGSLSGVSGPTPVGAECDLASGVHDWPAVPAGDLWFLVVGNDNDSTEGSWGRRSDGSERAGTTPSAQCGMTFHDNTGTCF